LEFIRDTGIAIRDWWLKKEKEKEEKDEKSEKKDNWVFIRWAPLTAHYRKNNIYTIDHPMGTFRITVTQVTEMFIGFYTTQNSWIYWTQDLTAVSRIIYSRNPNVQFQGGQ
jgi:hypothetical protein